MYIMTIAVDINCVYIVAGVLEYSSFRAQTRDLILSIRYPASTSAFNAEREGFTRFRKSVTPYSVYDQRSTSALLNAHRPAANTASTEIVDVRVKAWRIRRHRDRSGLQPECLESRPTGGLWDDTKVDDSFLRYSGGVGAKKWYQNSKPQP